jgi:tRNA (guanine-N7-)-methyltransferase
LPTRSRTQLAETVSNATDSTPSYELRSFGRRRGRTLSARQQALLAEALPRFALDLAGPPPPSLQTEFSSPVREVWLEIGFGGAEHLLWQAQTHADVGVIGCEVFEDGVVKALAGIEAQSLGNVRLSTEDAREVLRWLPPASLTRAFVLFPDPWPKKRHVKRRLLNRDFLDLMARVLAPGGELRIGTDIGDYARTILLAMRANSAFRWQADGPRDWRERCPDWPQTRYESKAREAGRRCYFFRFTRDSRP